MSTLQNQKKTRDPSKIVIFGLTWSVVWPLLLFGIVIVIAGEWNVPIIWMYFIMYGLILAAGTLAIPHSEDFWVERTRIQENTKSWDKLLAGPAFSVFWIAIYVVAGLDRRFGWTGEISQVLQIGAVVVAGLGYLLPVWAMASNRFYSRYVRIQTERGHTVVTTGPYRLIRHPGYAGIIVFMLSTPLALTSLMALIPAGIVLALLVIRTALEDRTLQAELPGYAEYARQVRYRLLPGVW